MVAGANLRVTVCRYSGIVRLAWWPGLTSVLLCVGTVAL